MNKIIYSLIILSSTFSQEIFEKGIISTDQSSEYGIAFISDSWICFTRKDKLNTLYFSYKKEGRWSKPEVAPFSGKNNDEYPSFDSSTQRLFFSSKRPISGTEEQAKNDIWYVELETGEWSTPKHLAKNFSGPGIDSGASGFGDVIYFHSDRSGQGMRSVDIYQLSLSKPDDEAVKLSINSNTVDGEVHLFNQGKAMLFMSAGHNAIGNSDIFLSRKENNSWSAPIALEKVNSKGWDYAPALSPDLKQLYFTRLDGRDANIYVINTSEISQLKSVIH